MTTPPPPTPEPGRPGPRTAVWIPIMVAVIAAIASIVVALISRNPAPQASPPTDTARPSATAAPAPLTPTPRASELGTIKSPASGDKVPPMITATGSATAVPAGHQLWIFVQLKPGGPLLPGNITQDGDSWTTDKLYVGGDNQAGQQFTLHLVDLDLAAQTSLEEYFARERQAGAAGSAGLSRSDLETWEATFLSQVDVTRKS